MTKSRLELKKRDIQKARKSLITFYDDLKEVAVAHEDCPLKLQELLDADDGNFYHDIIGIHTNLNRETRKLENCFVPRYAK